MKGELALLLKAFAFAAHKHRDQRRQDQAASPYINHPIALADVLVNEGGVADVEVLCAALLHDTVEDTATTPQELHSTFGARIAGIVAEVTDDTRLPKAERKRLQVLHAPHKSARARQLKGAVYKLATHSKPARRQQARTGRSRAAAPRCSRAAGQHSTHSPQH